MVNRRWCMSCAWASLTTLCLVLGEGRRVEGSTLALPLREPPALNAGDPEAVDNLPIILRYDLPKRNAFSSWGGKRSMLRTTDGLPIALRRAYLALLRSARPKFPTPDVELKRASFSPWGGKRSDPTFANTNIHRASFQPWGGKTAKEYLADPDEMNLEKNFLPYVSLLQSRELQGAPDEINQEPSTQWEDEQTLLNDDPSEYYIVDSNLPILAHDQVRFKREAPTEANRETQGNTDTQVTESKFEDLKPTNDKRVKFSAWAGKRPDINAIREVVRRWVGRTPKVPERRAFSAWAGKRSIHPELPETQEKRTFSAWAGKRSLNNYLEDVQDKRVFSAWAGKRSEDLNTYDTSLQNDQDERGFSTWDSKPAYEQEDNYSINNDSMIKMLEESSLDVVPDSQRQASLNAGVGEQDHSLLDDEDMLIPFKPLLGNLQEPNISNELLEKRVPFNAWAGKRTMDLTKRQPFRAWAGKRSNDPEKRQAFSAWAGKRSDDLEKRQAFHAWAGKRSDGLEKRQAFYAWAGKRSDGLEKRQAFSAWAGKRSDEPEKRQAFHAWAGKRSDDPEKRQSFSAWAGKRSDDLEKRQAFHAWAGKRSDELEKRQAFSAWAGKRSDELEKRQAFHAWAGKRSDELEKRQAFKAWGGKRSDNLEKRQAFSAWAGKRSDDLEKRQPFRAWAGKRNDNFDKRQPFNAWAGKRSDDAEKRQSFSAWAGKRTGDLEYHPAFSNSERESSTNEKRQSFSAWAGKRSDENLNNEDNHEMFTKLQNFNRQRYDVPLRKELLPLRNWDGKQDSFNTWEGNRSELISKDDNLKGLFLPEL